jgi:hypothetical protein
MPPVVPDPFVRALRDIESTLIASHIAVFPVWGCSSDHDITKLREHIAPGAHDFSHVPVRNGAGVVRGVVHRDKIQGSSGTAGSCMVELQEHHVVPANTQLRETMFLLGKEGFLLVRSPESGYPDGISGIINHADIQKTPVRLLLFARLTELEARLRGRIQGANWDSQPQCDWAVTSAKRKRDRFWTRDALPQLANYLNLREVAKVARQLGVGIHPELEEAAFETRAKELLKIRNDICHTNTLGGEDVSIPSSSIEFVVRAFEAIEAALLALAAE